MNHTLPSICRQIAFPSTRSALFAIIAWPLLFASACWGDPAYLGLFGLQDYPLQVFLAGFIVYCQVLKRHRFLHLRYFLRYAPDIERHRAMKTIEHLMIAADLADTNQFRAVVEERCRLAQELGFLVDGDNFYRKLSKLIRAYSWVTRSLCCEARI